MDLTNLSYGETKTLTGNLYFNEKIADNERSVYFNEYD